MPSGLGPLQDFASVKKDSQAPILTKKDLEQRQLAVKIADPWLHIGPQGLHIWLQVTGGCGLYTVLEGSSGSSHACAASLGGLQDLGSAPGPAAVKISWTADPQCPGGKQHDEQHEVAADSVIQAALALQAAVLQAAAQRGW